MEIMVTIWDFCKKGCLYLFVLGVIAFSPAIAQQGATVKTYTVKNGKMYIELGKQLAATSIDSFIAQFDLNGIGLKWFIQKHNGDSLEKQGWKIEINNKNVVVISKRLEGLENIVRPADRIVFDEKHPTLAEMFPAENNGVVYGFNRFKNHESFIVKDSNVTFFLRNHTQAKKVLLAGSFTVWQYKALSMLPVNNGWIITVKLKPGKYWYKFIVDGNWQTDSDNTLCENDGQGNINSVFYKTNVLFVLNRFENAKKVFLAGSFNHWQPGKLEMTKTTNGWRLPLYLAEGTHTYRFVVDGAWMTDPGITEKLPNEFGDYNSVLRIGKPYFFKLAGHADAREVILTGSFNNWRSNELRMSKTANGWQLPYTLGGGNYEYGFIVDGKLVPDPENQIMVKNHSYLVVAPNFTFRLKGHVAAKKVYLSGDFDEWSPNSLAMKKEGNEWIFRVHLSAGKHLYKYIVDGNWIIDPGNSLWEQNAEGTGNSIVWVDQ